MDNDYVCCWTVTRVCQCITRECVEAVRDVLPVGRCRLRDFCGCCKETECCSHQRAASLSNLCCASLTVVFALDPLCCVPSYLLIISSWAASLCGRVGYVFSSSCSCYV